MEILLTLVLFAVWFYGTGTALEALVLTDFAFRQPELMLWLLEHPEAGKELSPFLDEPSVG